MANDRERPTEKVVEELAKRGLTPDSNDPTRFVDRNGTVGGYADDKWFNNGTSNEKID